MVAGGMFGSSCSPTRTCGRRRQGRPTGDLPSAVWELAAGADAILHAGDVLDAGVLDRLAAVAPVHAVLGNNDRDLVGILPEARMVELAGVRIGMIHDSGPRAGRAGRLRRRFPDAGVVVFGHSHQPVDEPGLHGQWLFNPGSPTQRRGSPAHTAGELHLRAGRLLGHRIVVVDPPA
ncbi:MAG: metallophosphoesterase family protein [Acidimicrobiales bacterium]